MDIKVNQSSFFVFDLDDTLYQEIDFLSSAYRHIAGALAPELKESIYAEMMERYHRRENVFAWIVQQYKEHMGDRDTAWLLANYREHVPEITLSDEAAAFLKKLTLLKIPTGLITDGRSATQRNKLRSLGILDYFSDIIISEEFGSEKPDERNYLYFENKYAGKNFFYIGDNTKKDFIVPAQLGWTTICIKDKGKNIHKQEFDNKKIPQIVVNGFDELTIIDE